ncbi:MAG: phosphocholine cytidylyltransferase family protein [Flavobacteriales bacterium]|jgi:choline kinase|tara:strand:+ start:130409 stop:131089 length:681 start_codon:yes stop_codon:yes gene_type:complete
MKIIILAAGIGSRLGNPLPKPLTKLKNNKSIMQMMTENISSVYNTNIINLVVGFKKDLIMESFPDFTYVYNQYFDQTNTAKSLLKAVKKNKDQSILWMNGDIVFDKNILLKLKEYTDKDISFVSVNTSKVAEEEVKYTLKDDYIDELSKTVKNGLGEAVGINFISSDYIEIFIKRLEECDDNDYFERALEIAIEEDGFKIKPIDISEFNCIEIDFEEDLKNANNLI